MDTITANISATILANQIPLSPKRIGRINTDDNWNTSTRRKDTAAEIGPLPKAVKNDEVKMLMPASTKQNEKIRKAVIVIDNSSASYPTNIAEITGASVNRITDEHSDKYELYIHQHTIGSNCILTT